MLCSICEICKWVAGRITFMLWKDSLRFFCHVSMTQRIENIRWSTTLSHTLTTIWNITIFYTNIHGSLRMNPPDFDDFFTLCLVPPWGWYLCQAKCLIDVKKIEIIHNYWMYCHEMWYTHFWPLRMNVIMLFNHSPSSIYFKYQVKTLFCSVLLFMTKYMKNHWHSYHHQYVSMLTLAVSIRSS